MKEYRTIKTRLSEDSEQRKITGYAAKFDSYSEDLGGFREKIMPGAFAKRLPNADVRALFNHDPNMVLGRNKSGTLDLIEDEVGLRFEVDIPDTQWAKDLRTSMLRGDIDQCSFGFYCKEDRWEVIDGKDVRTLVDVDIFDVSVVTYPAYPETESQVRSLYESKRSELHPEDNQPFGAADENTVSTESTVTTESRSKWIDAKLRSLDRIAKLHNFKEANK